MKILRVLLGVAALALLSTQAMAQTPGAPTPAATQTPGTAPSASPVINKVIGTSSAWTNKVAIGSCVLNPASIPAGSSTLYDCTVLGAATTDKVFVNAQPTNTSTTTRYVIDECFFLQGAKVVSANTIEFRLVNRDMSGVQAALACDPPALSVDYILVRPNPQY